MVIKLLATFGALSALFYLVGVHLFKDPVSKRQEYLKVVLLGALTIVSLLIGRCSDTDHAKQGLPSYLGLNLFDLFKVFLLNSTLFAYVILYHFHTGDTEELWDTIKRIPKDYFIFKQLILAPLIEEAYFRLGFLLLVDRGESGAVWTYTILSSVCFGASHIKFGSIQKNAQMFIMTFVFGLYASFVMVKTQNLWCCILLHAYCNLLGPPQPLPENISAADAKVLKSVLYGGIIAFFALAYFL